MALYKFCIIIIIIIIIIIRAALISYCLVLSQTSVKAAGVQVYGHKATVTYGTPVYHLPAYTSTRLYCLGTEANVCAQGHSWTSSGYEL